MNLIKKNKYYDVFIHYDKKQEIDNAVAIAEGFSLLVFILPPIVFFYHKAWIKCTIPVILYVITAMQYGNIYPVFKLFPYINLVIALWIAFSCNDWRFVALSKSPSYKYIGTILAPDNLSALDFALREFFAGTRETHSTHHNTDTKQDDNPLNADQTIHKTLASYPDGITSLT